MICLHKLRGEELWVNANLISFVEGGPQTVLTLADGARVIVADPPEVVAGAIRRYHAEIIALAAERRDGAGGPADPSPHLRAVPSTEE